MRHLLALATVAVLASSVKAGAILSSYNLVAPEALVVPQTFQAVTPGVIPAAHQGRIEAHPAVVENAIAESQLPQELLNPFYKNPAIAAGLAKESWFTNKEFPVQHREAEKIPRSEIYKIISRLHGVHGQRR